MDSSKYAVKKSDGSRIIQNKGWGQYISHTSGLNDYHNSSVICFNRSGYTAVSGQEYYVVNSSDSSKTYFNQATKTVTAAQIATASGCNLKTTDECTAAVRVNWTSSSGGGGSDPTSSSGGDTCTDAMACGAYGAYCHAGSYCWYGYVGISGQSDCTAAGYLWKCGACYSSVGAAACE